MAHASGSGGTSVAPTPTHPHHLSRESSRDEIEMAESLRRLNQGYDNNTSRTDIRQQDQSSTTPQEGSRSEIYHSLEDAVPISGGPVAPATSTSLSISPPRSHEGASVPIAGQVCSNCKTTQTPLWRRSPIGETLCNACGLYMKARNQSRPVNLKLNTQTQPIVSVSQSPVPSATYVVADQMAAGTCPGGGRCNGTGGQRGCRGCPAFNNRVSKTAKFTLPQAHATTSNAASGGIAATGSSAASASGNAIPACQNCATTITPLWRRDDAGLIICNACGLYYKLHGTHRPVAMKKQEIKRRKRVAPAGDTSSHAPPSAADYSPPHRTLQTPVFEHSVSLDLSTAIESREEFTPEPRGPLAVDFTHYYGNATVTSNPTGLPPPSTQHGTASPRKRSRSATSRNNEDATSVTANSAPSRPNAIYSILNHARAKDTNIDPSLSVPLRSGGGPSSNPRTPQEDKATRRERLRREADVMRQELERKQKELDELDDD